MELAEMTAAVLNWRRDQSLAVAYGRGGSASQSWLTLTDRAISAWG
jgi:hypothetical protein